MSQKTPSVLVTFDSMKNPNSGYFYFGNGLGHALLKESKGSFKFSFYIFKVTEAIYKGLVDLIFLQRWHRIFFPYWNKFDVVHFTDQTCRLRPWRVSAKRIMTVHDINNVHLHFKSKARVKKDISKLKKRIDYCDFVVPISQFVADDILRFVPEAKDKIRVIHNGVDRLVVPENHQPPIVPTKPFLFTIGLLSPQKGFHLLPALLANNDYELVIAGIESPHKANIIAEAEKYNCLDRLIITGPVSDDDKGWYYKNCLAFAFPSIAEGFGLPVIEAMSFGKPVFLSRYTSLPEVGGEYAFYFDNFEPEHMQQVFTDGLQKFEKENYAPKVIEHAARFTWKIAAKKYMDLYHECLNS